MAALDFRKKARNHREDAKSAKKNQMSRGAAANQTDLNCLAMTAAHPLENGSSIPFALFASSRFIWAWRFMWAGS
jgi:hypothetical protein